MRRNTILGALMVLAGQAFGPVAAPSRRDIGDDDLFAHTPRNIERLRRDIVHVTAPEPLGKRAQRRARGKRKGSA